MTALLRSPKSDRLLGVHVVVTRPVHQAEALCRLIEAQAGLVIRFPVLAVIELEDKTTLSSKLQRLNNYDLIIFISPNAVDYGLRKIDAHGGLPAVTLVAAVGQGTAKALAAKGIHVDIFPSKVYDSEGLLAMPTMETVLGQQIAIVRGKGGRELLADTLRERGATVDHLECYQRVKPSSDPGLLLMAWDSNALDVIVVTSNTGLANLLALVTETHRQRLLDTPLVVVSQRMKQTAQELGFTKTPRVAKQASNEALLDALIKWHSSRRH